MDAISDQQTEERAFPHMDNLPRSIELMRDETGTFFSYIDQRKLPGTLEVAKTDDWLQVVDAVKTLAVRGAPALGVAGGAAVALWTAKACTSSCADEEYARSLDACARQVADARPTAVNLRWGVERVAKRARGVLACGGTSLDVATELCDAVKQMEREDEQTNRAIGEAGAALLQPGTSVLTHCNAGSLATVFYGTALGVVYSAAAQGKIVRVFADETRPVGQGARLTVWELSRAGVPTTLICDDMAASLMAQGRVQAVIVGADRIARNGDTANKIGTYGVAVLAHENGIPFYVAAPSSTFDFSLEDGSGIPIEQRDAKEVLPAPIEGVDVWNPAFDVTPARYITAIITEKGAFAPSEAAARLLAVE